LPTRVGPIAPDKLVFRSSWSPDALYLLLNLRYTGWHRYKATNTLTLFYGGEPLVADHSSGSPFAWLPRGRSFFRDKRIPRENLNGLLIDAEGLGQTIASVTGIGGRWAQDPPAYGQVEEWKPGPEVDVSRIVVDDWHGWRHRRSVHFHHNGPTVIVDDAVRSAVGRAAMAWHVAGGGPVQNQRVTLRAGIDPVEMVMLPVRPGSAMCAIASHSDGAETRQMLCRGQEDGRLSLVTVLLSGEWVGATGEIDVSRSAPVLRLEQGQKEIVIPLGSDLWPGSAGRR
jgi:hypothetical protein